MLNSILCYNRYGDPRTEKSLVMWDVPTELEIGIIPKRIYCNKDLIVPATQAFKNLIETGAVNELVTWDGCFHIRPVRGKERAYNEYLREGRLNEAIGCLSLHSWGVAIDLNASQNPMGKTPVLSKKFVNCFKSAGFDWGGEFANKDGMHFQLKEKLK